MYSDRELEEARRRAEYAANDLGRSRKRMDRDNNLGRRVFGDLAERDGLIDGRTGADLSEHMRDEIHVGHIIPVSQGGGDELSNLRLEDAASNMRCGNAVDPTDLTNYHFEAITGRKLQFPE